MAVISEIPRSTSQVNSSCFSTEYNILHRVKKFSEHLDLRPDLVKKLNLAGAVIGETLQHLIDHNYLLGQVPNLSCLVPESSFYLNNQPIVGHLFEIPLSTLPEGAKKKLMRLVHQMKTLTKVISQADNENDIKRAKELLFKIQTKAMVIIFTHVNLVEESENHSGTKREIVRKPIINDDATIKPDYDNSPHHSPSVLQNGSLIALTMLSIFCTKTDLSKQKEVFPLFLSKGITVQQSPFSNLWKELKGFFAVPTAEAAGKEQSGGTYVVQSGDTLFGIANRKFGVSVAALKAANGITGDQINVGQVLNIPGGGGTPNIQPQQSQVYSPEQQQQGGGTYVVQSGDTLFGIANRKFGVSVAALKAANGITGDQINVGQVLNIPGGGGTPNIQPQQSQVYSPEQQQPAGEMKNQSVNPIGPSSETSLPTYQSQENTRDESNGDNGINPVSTFLQDFTKYANEHPTHNALLGIIETPIAGICTYALIDLAIGDHGLTPFGWILLASCAGATAHGATGIWNNTVGLK